MADRKACSRCAEVKSPDDFRARKGGTVAACRTCESAWHRAHYLANREQRLQQSRDWYEANKDTRRASQKAWYEANREKVAEDQRRRAKANPGERARQVRRWREQNPERDAENTRQWREANRERLRSLARLAYSANPEKFIEREAQRRARVADTAIGPVDLDALWTGHCGICRESLDRATRYPDPLSKSLDHIIPLARGGGHVQENLQWAHLFCNVSKGAKLPDCV